MGKIYIKPRGHSFVAVMPNKSNKKFDSLLTALNFAVKSVKKEPKNRK